MPFPRQWNGGTISTKLDIIWGMSAKRHRFPADVIRHSIWLYARFTLSFRDVEEMVAERGLDGVVRLK